VNPRLKLVFCFALLLCCYCSIAQGADVTAQFTVKPTAASHAAGKNSRHPALDDVVLWLTRADDSTPIRAVPPPKTGYRLVQKDKMFSPHLLVVPAGSNVEFPNLDPFFHNVFSLFNGKRFDLGLYESGTHRSVRFDREGVSYIFCNIHPEMGAIVLALDSPYFAVSDAGGAVTIHDVPPGKYRLHVWGEQFQAADSAEERRIVEVTTQGTWLGPIELAPGPNPLMNHKNKFGEDYSATPTPTY
jgi:plastocyanin